MPRRCCVGGCGNTKENNLSLHTFPKDTLVRDQWIRAIRGTGTNVSRTGQWTGPNLDKSWNSQLVCSVHFDVESFTLTCRLHWQEGMPYTAKLVDGAVPRHFGDNIAIYRSRQPVLRAAFRKREVQRIMSEYSSSTSPQTGPAATLEQQATETTTCLADGVLQSTSTDQEPRENVQSIHDEGNRLLSPQPEHRSRGKKNEKTKVNKSVQVNVKRPTDIASKVKTCVKRTQTLKLHHITYNSRPSQYDTKDCPTDHSEVIPTQLKPCAHSTPMKTQPGSVQISSPGLNSTFTSIATDNIAQDPDYLADESGTTNATDDDLDHDRKPPTEERKFLVFEENLLSLFQVCQKCHGSTTAEVVQVIGTFATVHQDCSCGFDRRWHSQPLIGSTPAGNVLLSAAILVQCNKGVAFIHFFKHVVHLNRDILESPEKILMASNRNSLELTCEYQLQALIYSRHTPIVIAGDARADSPGHSAKYGTYSIIDMETGKVIDVQLVQSNEVKSSYHMELEGLKRCVSALEANSICIGEIVTDRHLQIQKWIRENMLDTKHSYDVWHISKGIKKKLLAAAKLRQCAAVYQWIKSITNHVYWCAASSVDAGGDMIVSKWMSVASHVQNIHCNHEGQFGKCQHEDLMDRDWIKPGTIACIQLEKIILNERLCKDVAKMSTGFQTCSLESFHSVINQFAPKMTVYSFHGQLCRQHLAALHFNENVRRTTAKTKDGRIKIKINFPKYKSNDEYSVREKKEEVTFTYVKTLMAQTVVSCEGDVTAVATPAPPPLTSGKRKPTREEAIATITKRSRKLFDI